MELLIITGMSGAGKSKAIGALEDIGFYCIDNMPPQLIGAFTDIIDNSNLARKGAAIVTDLRGGDLFENLVPELQELKKRGKEFKLLFLDADDRVLVRRYRETRRKHPLIDKTGGNIEAAVKTERELLSPISRTADYHINTSNLLSGQLKERLSMIFTGGNTNGSMSVLISSFGFKYGDPTSFDLVFDVRCLPNPFYDENLKDKTGKDQEIEDYVMGFQQSKDLYQKITQLIDFSIPLYQKEGKALLSIGFGCTGGKHRSVLFAELLHKHLKTSTITHRDIDKK
jgi:Predicted P-loop-containing kinase